MNNREILQNIDGIVAKDGRYHRDAFIFVLSGLDYSVNKLPKRRHLTGQELSRGIADFAREQFGYMAQTVLEHWGLRGTLDFGEIVYLLIGSGLMSRTEDDRIEDFADVYCFDDEFVWDNMRNLCIPGRL